MRPSISGVLDSLAGSIQDRRATSADYHPRQPPAPRAGRPEGWGGGMPGTGGVSVYGDIPLSWAPQIFLEEFDSSATSTKAGTGQSDRWRHVPAGQGALREPDDYGHARDRGGGS